MLAVLKMIRNFVTNWFPIIVLTICLWHIGNQDKEIKRLSNNNCFLLSRMEGQFDYMFEKMDKRDAQIVAWVEARLKKEKE